MSSSVIGAFRKAALPTLFCAVGLVMAFHPTLFSGFARVQRDPGDTLFNNYLLEHTVARLTGAVSGGSWWDPPIFHPARNTAAYSDLLWGASPLYWIWRAAGMAPDTSFQVWMLLVSILNFSFFYLWLRRCLSLPPPGACFGAFLFAFGNSRIAHIGHQQLLPQFFLIGALMALHALFTAEHGSKARWIFVFCFCLLLQLYTAFYFAWFFFFSLCIALAAAVGIGRARAAMWEVLKRQYVSIAAAVLISVLALAPWLHHYSDAAKTVGRRGYREVSTMLVPLQAWADMGPDNWIYGRWHDAKLFRSLPMEWEKRLGLGLITSLAAAYGLWRWRRGPLKTLMLSAGAVLLLLTLQLPNGFSLWTYVFQWVPGAQALRAVSRMGLFLLIPLAAGFAFTIDRLCGKRPWAALAVGLVCVLEQAQTPLSYEKQAVRADVARIAAAVDPEGGAFLYTPMGSKRFQWQIHLEAMWAGWLTGVPTVNGYSGNAPPGWAFGDPVLDDRNDERRLSAALESWKRRWPRLADEKPLQWIRIPQEDLRLDGAILPFRLIGDHGFMDSIGGMPVRGTSGPLHVPASREPLIIRGWAADGSVGKRAGGAYVEIGERLFKARYGLERPDVARNLGNPELLPTGFEARIPPTTLKKGRCDLKLVILTHDCAAYFLPGRPVTIIVE
jgi:hypothetical protein